jgi:hypothetical protein
VELELVEPADSVTGFGLQANVSPTAGVVEFVRVIEPVNPLIGVKVTLIFEVVPTTMVTEDWLADMPKLAPLVTVIVVTVLVLPLCVESPLYEAVIDPDPILVPVKMTEQLPADDKLQPLALREPPVVPAVNAKLTVPVGVFEVVLRSVTVTTTVAVQLVAVVAMLQFIFGTAVMVESSTTVMLARVLAALM